jgi:hypothetical protein
MVARINTSSRTQTFIRYQNDIMSWQSSYTHGSVRGWLFRCTYRTSKQHQAVCLHEWHTGDACVAQELEVCGYGCEDHYLEQDTFLHCNESLADILRSGLTDGPWTTAGDDLVLHTRSADDLVLHTKAVHP